jgi:hypothetical protein
MSTKQSKRPKPSKTATRRELPRRATAGKGQPGKAVQQHISDVDGLLDELPKFLLASDIAALLNISKTESYRVLAACGALRIGNRKRLVRVSKVRFLRYLAQRQEAA